MREGRTLQMQCVNVRLKWCKISSINRKGNASINGTLPPPIKPEGPDAPCGKTSPTQNELA